MAKRYHIAVIQHVEEDFYVDADTYEEACEQAEQQFRDEFDIPSFYGDYTTEHLGEEEIEDEDDA